jgi:hypothetical protein
MTQAMLLTTSAWALAVGAAAAGLSYIGWTYLQAVLLALGG